MKASWVFLAFASCLGSTFIVSGQEKEPAKIKTDLQTLVEGNNEFAFDLYARLSKEKGNKFFSPYSISTALGMTYAGARGNTAKEMAKTLHFTLDNEQLHPAFGELIRKIQGADKKRNYELTVANSLWGAKGFSLEPQFLRIVQTDYQAGFQFADFAGDPERARRRINGWVEDKTNKKIENLIPEGLLQSTTRLVLVNAIWFKADWASTFPKAATKPDDFALPGGAKIKVPMMNHAIVANYMANANFQLAELRYKDDEVAMVVILPKKKDGLADVENNLSARSLAETLALGKAANLPIVYDEQGRAQPIEKFRVGDRVLSRNEFDPAGPLMQKTVLQVFKRFARVLEVQVRGRVIGTTGEHPFFVLRKYGFVPAGELELGDIFLSNDGQWVTVGKIHDTGKYEWVYNLKVADFHTYFVGGEDWGFSVWAHNTYSTNPANPPPSPLSASERLVIQRQLLEGQAMRQAQALISRYEVAFAAGNAPLVQKLGRQISALGAQVERLTARLSN